MTVSVKNFIIASFQSNEELKYDIQIHHQDPSTDAESIVEHFNQNLSSKSSKTFYDFSDSDSVAKSLIKELSESNKSLTDIASPLCDTIQHFLSENPLTKSGSILLMHYDYLATSYLMITMLDESTQFTLNEHNKISRKPYIDSSSYLFFARFDLTQINLRTSANMPITFCKKLASNKYNTFFTHTFGCGESTTSHAVASKLVSSVEGFLSNENNKLEDSEKDEIRSRAQKFAYNQARDENIVSIPELSEAMTQGSEFADYYKHEVDASIEVVEVDKKVLKSLSEFKGQGGGLTISFEDKLLGDRITYNPNTDQLIISGIPPNLRDQLQRRGQKGVVPQVTESESAKLAS